MAALERREKDELPTVSRYMCHILRLQHFGPDWRTWSVYNSPLAVGDMVLRVIYPYRTFKAWATSRGVERINFLADRSRFIEVLKSEVQDYLWDDFLKAQPDEAFPPIFQG